MTQSRLISGAAWCVVSSLLARLSGAAVLFVSARYLNSEEFGQLSLIQATAVSGGTFIGLGCGIAAAACLAKSLRQDKDKAAAELTCLALITLATTLLLGACIAIFAKPLSLAMFGAEEADVTVLIAVPLVVANSLALYLTGVLNGFQAYRMNSYINMVTGAVGLTLTTTAAIYGSLVGVVACLLTTAILSVAILVYAVVALCHKHQLRPTLRGLKNNWKSVGKVATPSILLNSVHSPTDYVAFLLLARQPNGVVELGIYYVLNQWSLLIRFAPLAASSVITPTLASATDDDRSRLRITLLRRGALTTFVAAGLAAVSLAVVGDWLLPYHGDGYAGRSALFNCVVASGALIATQLVAERILLGLHRFWTAFCISGARGACFCLLATATVSGGAEGLAIARSVTFALALVASLAALVWPERARSADTSGGTTTSEAQERLAA